MHRRFWLAKELLLHFGFSWVLRRVIYSIKVRTGWLERTMPLAKWTETPLVTCLIDEALAEPAAYTAHRRNLAERFLFQAEQFREFRSLFNEWDTAGRSPVTEATVMTGANSRGDAPLYVWESGSLSAICHLWAR